MKTRFIIIAAAAVTLIAACGGKSVEQKLADYNAWSQEFMATYHETIQGIIADSTITDEEERSRKVSEYADGAYEQYKNYNLQVIKENKGNAVSLEALKSIYSDLEPDEIIEIVQALKDTLAQDPAAQKILAGAMATKNTAEGLMFTDFEVDGVKLSDFVGKGKYVLVDFWASWCGPCRREMPNLRSVYEKYHGDNFDMLSVAVWDKPEDTAKAAEEEQITWNQIVNAQKIPTDIYGIQGIPHIILFGPDGTILKRNLRGEQIAKTVAEYVK